MIRGPERALLGLGLLTVLVMLFSFGFAFDRILDARFEGAEEFSTKLSKQEVKALLEANRDGIDRILRREDRNDRRDRRLLIRSFRQLAVELGVDGSGFDTGAGPNEEPQSTSDRSTNDEPRDERPPRQDDDDPDPPEEEDRTCTPKLPPLPQVCVTP